MSPEEHQAKVSKYGNQASVGNPSSGPRACSLPVAATPQSPKSPCSLPPIFEPLPPLPPQLVRYLGVKSPSRTPSEAKNIRHSTPLPAATVSYSVSLFHPSERPLTRTYPPYRPYYLIQDDSDPARKPKQLKKSSPIVRSSQKGISVDSDSIPQMASALINTRKLADTEDRFRSFSVVPKRPVVGGDSVFRMPYNNIPKDNLSFTLGIFSFLPLGQGAPRNAMHAARIEAKGSESKEYNVYDSKSIEGGRVESPPLMVDNGVNQYDEKLGDEGVGTFRSFGIIARAREALTNDVKHADSEGINLVAQSFNGSGKTGRIPVSRNGSRMPGPGLSLFSVRTKGIVASKSCPNIKAEAMESTGPLAPTSLVRTPTGGFSLSARDSKCTTFNGKKNRKKLVPGAWWR